MKKRAAMQNNKPLMKVSLMKCSGRGHLLAAACRHNLLRHGSCRISFLNHQNGTNFLIHLWLFLEQLLSPRSALFTFRRNSSFLNFNTVFFTAMKMSKLKKFIVHLHWLVKTIQWFLLLTRCHFQSLLHSWLEMAPREKSKTISFS